MNNPFGNDFSPYDALIELNERIGRLEQAHNNLAHAFEATDAAFDQLLQSHQNLQKAHLTMSQLIGLTVNPLNVK